MAQDARQPTTKRIWRAPDGTPVSCYEKLKVLEENLDEIREMAQEALEDAVLMGYELLSNEVVITVRQIGNIVGFQKHCVSGPKNGTDIWFDLDNNDQAAPDSLDCPQGQGGMAKVPR